MRENHFIRVNHVDGKLNLAGIYTKGMKDIGHFVELRDVIMCSRSESY
jgi:hypothetical protein